MKYAVFTVCAPEWDVHELPAALSRMGYDGVEWRVAKRSENPRGTDFWRDNKATVEFDTVLDEAPRLRDAAGRAGLEMPAVGFYVNCADTGNVRIALKAAALLGAPAARIGVPGYDGAVNYNELFKKAVEQYREVERIAADSGVKALAELHMGNIIPSASAAFRFASNFDPERVGLILDPGNMIYEGYENWRLGCELLGPYLAHVYAKNAKSELVDVAPEGYVRHQLTWAPMRAGMVDWLAVMRALKAVGYDGWISVEDFSKAGPLRERLEDDLAFLKLMQEKAASC